jgi:hypothetical protein
MGKPSNRIGWAFFWLATGVCALVAMDANPEMPPWSIVALLLRAGLSFTAAIYYFGWFKAPIPIGTIPRTIILLAVLWGLIFALYQRLGPRPQITFLEAHVLYLDKPNLPIFANIVFQNIGAKGRITTYSYSALSPLSVKSSDVRKQLWEYRQQLVSQGGGLIYTIGPQEKKWFTIFGPTLTPEQASQLKAGGLAFYFSATMLADPSGDILEACYYIVGSKPDVILQCEE